MWPWRHDRTKENPPRRPRRYAVRIRLQQLPNRRRILQHIHRPPARVEQLQARVDAEHVVDGGVDVARRQRASLAGVRRGGSVEPTTMPPLTPPPPIRQNMELPQ